MEFQFEDCEGLMKLIFGGKYLPKKGEPYCRRDPIDGKTLPAKIEEVLEDLRRTRRGERKRKIIILWCGLEDGQTQSLGKIGQEFQVTGERIRQIKEVTLRQLRHPSRSNKLKPYLESASLEATLERLREVQLREVQKRREKLQQEEREKFDREKEEGEKERREKAQKKMWAGISERLAQFPTLSFEERQEEIRALRRVYEKTSSTATAYCPERFIERIIRSGIRYSHLTTFNEEELAMILGMGTPDTKTEQCLREMWQLTNQKS